MATKTWLGGTTGNQANDSDWTRKQNWSSGVAPAAADDIVIGTAAFQPVISTTNNLKISSLILHNGGSLTFTTSGATLTLNGTGTGTGAFKGLTNDAGATITLANNTISVTSTTGAITNAGSITMSGGTLSDLNAGIGNSGTITSSSSGTSFLASGAAGTNNSGTLSVTAGSLQVTGTGGLTNAAAGHVSIIGSIVTPSTLQITGALTNSGQLTVNGGTLQENGAGITNAGTITTAGTSTIAAAAGTNVTGTLAVNSGDLTVTGALTDAAGGHITLASSATLTDANGITMGGGTLSGFGTLGANTNVTGSGTVAISISNAGTITASGGTLDLTGSVSGRTLAINTIAGSDLKIDGTTTSAAIAINDANQTLEVGALGNLTFTGAESITNGTIQLDGGILNGGTLTIGSGGKLNGSGTVNNAIDGTGGTITANGTLNLTGTVASGQSFAIDSGSTLKFSGIATASIPISISSGTLEIGALGSSLTINSAQSVSGGGTIKLDGGTLTDSSGLTVGTGGTLTGFGTAPNNITLAGGTVSQSGGVLNATFITGFGTVDGVTGTAIAGAHQIVASGGGTLDLKDTVSGAQLVVDGTKSGVANLLKVDGNVTAGGDGSIQITGTNSTNQAVEIGATGSLTLSKAQSIVGTIRLDGGSSTLTDTSGLSVNGGALLIGSGSVNAGITGVSGLGNVVEASGGLLAMNGAVGGAGLTYEIANSSASVLEISAGGPTTGNFDFLGSAGELEFNGATALSENIAGLNVGSAGARTNFIDFLGRSLTVNDSLTGHTGSTGTFKLSDGTVLNLSGINAAGTWFLDWRPDAAGTDMFVSTAAVCYAAGTQILTVTGERAVESLMRGDIVLTLSDGELVAQPVKWIGRRRIDLIAHPHPETVAPVRIARGAFAEAMPHRDLLLSPDHAVFVDGKLICARQLVNGSTIRRETDWTAVEYYHVELDAHAILLAEGLPAESYLDTGNRGFFANGGGPLVLHPDLTDESDYPARAAGSCAPFVTDEAGVLPVWQRLAERAAALGQPALRLDTTADPELRIVAKGRTVRPLYGENGLYIFALPKGATEVRVVSRAGSPADARPWLDDRRCLGVNVERIVLRNANELREVPVDHPGLTQGWHAVERDGVALRRWTSGDAVLPLPTMAGPTMLEIRASSGGMAYLAGAEQEQRAA